jgi:quinoprotein glucose dehydrogenase
MSRSARLGGVLIASVAVFLAAQASDPPGQWRHYGGDAGSTKYSPLSQIDRGNVANLRVAWRWTSPDNEIAKTNAQAQPGFYQDTPLYVNGVLYTTTSLGVIAAIDAGTGKTIWQFDPESWKAGRPTNLGFTHRGVSYWTDGTSERIIIGTHEAYLMSIDAKTGKPDMNFGVNGRVDAMERLPFAVRVRNYAITSTPVVVRNVIIHGANISDGPQNKEAPRGDVSGYDVRTGKRLWTFRSVPGPGEFGHDTWESDSAEYSGNTNVWSMISTDPVLGYVYLPFGTPTNDYYGGHRPGNNLFAESLVCLDATTGKRIWHFQAVHHGLWDWDFPAAPTLGEIRVDGKPISIVAQVSKQGWVYVFDRRTGVPVWPIEERPVPQTTVPGEKTSPTQPFPTKPPPFERQGFTADDVIDFTPELRARALEILKPYKLGPIFTPPSLEGTVQMPSNGGGANWSGAAFDPVTQMLYVPSITSPFLVQLTATDPARSNMRYRRGSASLPQIDGLSLSKPPYSRITAYNLNTGTIAWQVPIGEGQRNHPLLKGLNVGPLGSGRGYPLLTSTLLIVGHRAGSRGGDVPPEPPALQAMDKATGQTITRVDLPYGPVASPMTYMHQGRQFIVAAIGNGPRAELIAMALPQ